MHYYCEAESAYDEADARVAAARAISRDYEPDYNAHIAELESLEVVMANVGSYDDWFVEEGV